MEERTDLKIPYGVADFKTIRNEGLYYVDKTEYLAKLEARDRFVFFVRLRRFGKSLFVDMLRLYYDRFRHGDFVRDSYIIELKHSESDASDADLAAKAEEGIAQLRRYAADPMVPALSSGTRLHLILYQFRGSELVRCEEISRDSTSPSRARL